MIVKVVPPDYAFAHTAATYHDVGRSYVATGKFWFHESPTKRQYQDIGEFNHLHILGIDDEPITQGEENWPVRWATWFADGRTVMAVTSGEIYVRPSGDG